MLVCNTITYSKGGILLTSNGNILVHEV